MSDSMRVAGSPVMRALRTLIFLLWGSLLTSRVKIAVDGTKARSRLRVGVLNLTANEALYDEFDDIKRRYYSRMGIPFRFVYNERIARAASSEEMIYVSDDPHDASGVPVMLEKFMWALKCLLDTPPWSDCDYIIRTNASTFVNFESLEQFLPHLPARRCYAGSVAFHRMISGTAIVFSRDALLHLANLEIGSEKYRNDDVTLRDYMFKYGTRMRDLPMKHFIDNRIHSREEIEGVLAAFPLVRVRNSADRELYDLDIWRKIAEIRGI